MIKPGHVDNIMSRQLGIFIFKLRRMNCWGRYRSRKKEPGAESPVCVQVFHGVQVFVKKNTFFYALVKWKCQYELV